MEDTDVQICLMAETHVPTEGVNKAVGEARQKGWRAEFAPAATTLKGGTTGGAAVFARGHLACRPLDPALEPRGKDWVAMGLEVRGFKIVHIAAYLNDDNTEASISSGN